MELSAFLAKLIGLYLLVIGALWLVRGDFLNRVAAEFLASRPLVLLAGVSSLLIGLAMALGHSVWQPNWRGLVTLIGYVSIVQGIVRIAFPEWPAKAAATILKPPAMWMWLGVIVALGAYLTWAGFTYG